MRDMREIDKISTDDLMEELMSRCKPAVFIGTKHEGGDGNSTWFHAKGSPYACYGLCHELAMTIMMSEIKRTQEG